MWSACLSCKSQDVDAEETDLGAALPNEATLSYGPNSECDVAALRSALQGMEELMKPAEEPLHPSAVPQKPAVPSEGGKSGGKGSAPSPPAPLSVGGKAHGKGNLARNTSAQVQPAKVVSLEEALKAKKDKLKTVTPMGSGATESVGTEIVDDPFERTAIVESLYEFASGTKLGVVLASEVHVSNSNLDISAKQDLLGIGRFASVVRADVSARGSSVPVAVASKRFTAKEPPEGELVTSERVVPLSALRTAKKEAEALRSIGPNPYVVELLGMVLPHSGKYEVEFGANEACTVECPLQLLLKQSWGSLHMFLQDKGGEWTKIRREGKLSLVQDVAHGIAAIHDAGFAHLDIKSHNILVDCHSETGVTTGREWHARICDLGSARRVSQTSSQQPAEGTSGWTAPELLHDDLVSSSLDLQLTDVFSFGVVIWAITSGPQANNPLAGLAGEEYCAALSRGVRPSFPENVPVYDEVAIAMECWQMEPSNRPAMSEILRRLPVALNDPKYRSSGQPRCCFRLRRR